ncbi:class I SAM-dependent methyltransferase [Sphaerisporangium perillae]|uniref:class I SAM-dependent methyltransferase n=1 Tax=Sphaerisporangium perillae TaxID=2935860 RepID=UPI00200EFD20|nr:class I SAM-dependent methyltransferase [Sphaerisporangium perillae]
MTDDQVFHACHGTGVETARAGDRDRLHWILDHLPASRPGRPMAVLDLGCGEGDLSLLLAERGDQVTGIDPSAPAIANARRRAGRLPADVAARVDFTVGDAHGLDGLPEGAFDATVAGEILDRVADPVQVLETLRRTLRPGATLVFTVPYGVSDEVLRIARAAGDEREIPRAAADGPEIARAVGHELETDRRDERRAGEEDGDAERRRVFYHGSMRHLVEPLFEIRELTVLRHHLAGVAVRRDEPRGTPGFALSRAETAFLQRERLLHGQIAELRARCAELAARELTLTRASEDLLGRNAELRAETTRLGHRVRQLEGRLAEYRELIARLRRSRAWRLITAYRRVRHPAGREIPPPPPTAKRPMVIAAPTSALPRPGRTEER